MSYAKFIIMRFISSSTATPRSVVVNKNAISIDSVKELHGHLIRAQLHRDSSSISDVVKFYALSPPNLHKAHLVFNQIERPTLLVLNYMIRGLALSDRPSEAILIYNRIYYNGFVGNNLTFIFVFKACGRVSDVFHGRKIHVHALKLGFGSCLFVCNALIYMYAMCGELGLARKVFDEMPERDLVSWNSLICGYSQCNRFKEVLSLFNEMMEVNVKADSVTMVKVILACSCLGDWRYADCIVKYILENEVKIDVYLGNTLIDMYGRRGLVDLARRVFDQMSERNVVSWNAMIMGHTKLGKLVAAGKLFDEMPKRDVISWTSMITGYSQAKQFTKAIQLFQEMRAAKMKPDEITLASVISACAHLGSLDVGEAIHNYICEHGVKVDFYVLNSLIDMYCKCGVVEKALKVFQQMQKDSVSWSSIISGLAVNGFANMALEIFSQMLRERVQPTHGTFIGVILACAHAGLVDKGLDYFESMERVHGLTPEMKHYGCIVDLLSRSGNLDRAYEFIKSMPIAPGAVVWRILLSACKLHDNVLLAQIAIDKLLKLDPSNSGDYILLSNTYAGSDRWDDAIKTRELMEESAVRKPSGHSSIEICSITSNNFEDPFIYEKSNKLHSVPKTKDYNRLVRPVQCS